MTAQQTWNGKITVRLRMNEFFNRQGHSDFTSRELAERFDCSMTCAARYRRFWAEEKEKEERGPRCIRCGFYGWEKSPILETGRCLWCELEREGGQALLQWYAMEVGWK